MPNTPWSVESLKSMDDYRCPSIQSQLLQLFGTDKPVAWITGSASDRVGRAIAKRFAMHGYRLVIHGNHSVKEGAVLVADWQQSGIDAMLISGSIDDEATVKSWVTEIDRRFGRLDVLVHSAAQWTPKKLEQTTADDLQQQISVNTIGMFLCAQQAGLYMAKQPTGGGVILIGDWAIERPYCDFAAYFASKASIPTLTRTFAVELATRNPRMRVNSILPGPVMLPEGTRKETQSAIEDQCLLKMLGKGDHVARAAVFLAEHEFLTGICLPVDGGRTIYAKNDSDAIAHSDFR